MNFSEVLNKLDSIQDYSNTEPKYLILVVDENGPVSVDTKKYGRLAGNDLDKLSEIGSSIRKDTTGSEYAIVSANSRSVLRSTPGYSKLAKKFGFSESSEVPKEITNPKVGDILWTAANPFDGLDGCIQVLITGTYPRGLVGELLAAPDGTDTAEYGKKGERIELEKGTRFFDSPAFLNGKKGTARALNAKMKEFSEDFMAIGPEFAKMEKLRQQYENEKDPEKRKTLRNKMKDLTAKTGVKAFDDSTWDAEVDPELMKVVPTINKFLIDEATRISDETGRKVYPKDLINAVLKSIDPTAENFDSPSGSGTLFINGLSGNYEVRDGVIYKDGKPTKITCEELMSKLLNLGTGHRKSLYSFDELIDELSSTTNKSE